MKVKKFFQTALIGGLAAILPLGLIIIIVRWIIVLIERYLKPLVSLLEPDSRLSTIITYIIAVAAILTVFFLIGLFIQTRFGNMVRNHLENRYLMKIPGYKTARDVVRQFFGNKNSFFSEVVLVDVYGTGVLLTGFLTDQSDEFVTVFVPTAPNPTSGFVFHVPREKVFKSNTPVDVAIKSIISCGAGSVNIISNKMEDPISITKLEEKDN
jgi:uncharacterized membrane protein